MRGSNPGPSGFQEQSSWSLAITGHLYWEINKGYGGAQMSIRRLLEQSLLSGLVIINEKQLCKQIELHYIELKCLWCGTEARKVRRVNGLVRKGKSSGNLPTRKSTATIGVF
ncbi:hypothetical protein LOTGIDRAFT_175766 [Lottia gigantea]|uniref:Uncharacterized protein n=1 Tax=Lottia gigantea TaxID=225164 RepID=V4A4S3_LOTGI|nr:hypothetical protein LOTGIDRAFT_175766 [Lottia gigantea]ESO91717.1 hypothetical protein LOTGIDRAFT_175766 [Lottia gigantea]